MPGATKSFDPINVKVNNLDDYTIIGRTPVIILGSLGKAYRSMISYNWRDGYPRLDDLKKKPSPIAIYHLFKRYNLTLDTSSSNE